MFRELIESNGTVLNYEDLKTFYRGSISDIPYTFYRLKGKDEVVNNKVYNSVEEMYLDYCIENGVKLEWLGKCELTHEDNNQINVFIKEKGIDFEYDYASKLISYIGEVLDDVKILKLICAIFAHEIKIIA